MAYTRKIAITFDHTQVVGGADLTNFTVPVVLSHTELKTTGNGGLVTNASGFDIAAFADSALVTPLKFQRLAYSATTGQWIAWVKVPTLSFSADTTIYVAYANSAVSTDQQDKVNAWDANTVFAKPFFGDGTTLDLTDHTGNFPLTNAGATAAAGLIAGAASFNGTSAYMKKTGGAPVSAYPLTIETVLKPAASVTTTQSPVSLDASASSALGMAVQVRATDAVRAQGGNSGTTPQSANSVLDAVAWHFIGAVYTSATNRRLSVDGATAASSAVSAGTTATPDNISVGAVANSNTQNQFYNGLVNCVLVSNVTRTDGWLQTRSAAVLGFATFSSAGAPSAAAGNTAPTATITSQSGYSTYEISSGRALTLTGTGVDPEDGTLSGAALAWSSSRDGALGTGASITKSNLSVGTHVITLTATDSSSATGTATKTVVVKDATAWHFIKRDVPITAITFGAYTAKMQVLVPANYNPALNYPLMMEYGGSGQRGNDNTTQMTDGYAAKLNANPALYSGYGSFWVFPQFPGTGTYGGREYAFPLIAAALVKVMAEWNINASKLHFTGYSLGAQVALESLYNLSPAWASVHVAEGTVTNREGLLSGNDPAGSWTQTQAANEVAGRNAASMQIRQYQESSDTNNTPTNAQIARDAWYAVDPAHQYYTYIATSFGTGHVAAYQAMQNDTTNLDWAFGISRGIALPTATPSRVDIDALSYTSSTTVTAATLQSTINAKAALASGNHEIIVQDGQLITSEISLPTRGGSGYIVIRSQTMPALRGIQVHPSMFTTQAVFRVGAYQRSFQTATVAGVAKYVLAGLWMEETATDAPHFVGFGDNSSSQNDVSLIPDDLHLDRCYALGADIRRAVGLHSKNSTITECYLSAGYSGADAQAIFMANGPGPYLIEHNHLEGSGETIMAGGQSTWVPGNIPADITIRLNSLQKPRTWKTPLPTKKSVKNLIEMKASSRTLIEGNFFDGNWSDGQTGTAVLFKSVDQEGLSPWLGTFDLTFRYNFVRNMGGFCNLSANPQTPKGVDMTRVAIHNNVAVNIGADGFDGDDRSIMMTGASGASDYQYFHNTVAQKDAATSAAISWLYGPLINCIFTDNIDVRPVGTIGIKTDSISSGQATWNSVTSGASSLTRNVFSNHVTTLPPGNFLAASTAAFGFVDHTIRATCDVAAPDTICANLTLAAGSAYKGVGAGGTDPGADMAVVRAFLGISYVPGLRSDDLGSFAGAGPNVLNPPAPPTATAVGVSVQPNDAGDGVPHSVQPRGTINDQYGAVKGDNASTVTATLITITGVGSAVGSTTTPVVSGAWAFTNLGVDTVAGGTFKWRFSDGALTTADSAVFAIGGPDVAPGGSIGAGSNVRDWIYRHERTRHSNRKR